MKMPVTGRLLTRDIEGFTFNSRDFVEGLYHTLEQWRPFGNVSGNRIIAMYGDMTALITDAQHLARKGSIEDHAERELGMSNREFVKTLNTYVAAMTAAAEWIRTNYPTDSEGWVQNQKITNGGISTRGWDTEDAKDLIPLLQAIIDTTDFLE